MSKNSLARFILRARRAAGLRGRVNVLVTDGEQLRSLNREFRGQNKSTDVLSFSSEPLPKAGLRPKAAAIGDLAISADMAANNAARLGHTPAEEVKILALHGILHLAGFDHENDDGEMARKEALLRRKLGLPGSLIERARSGKKSTSASSTRRRAAATRSSK